ncbi:antitermination regulator [Nocardioides aromaticivorans]|uniref:Antitermination regulator n=1 Tax=Nocardioides aromaticivorans TaxID=200618 RepID=A0ABX7PEQ5_9ACTN|nr:GAF and ANTAR domain-containing protein [Nocardioides aromaticivorans]QSR24175.1 antitermination regulator [Nocardioides aromaticivorans]
MTSSVSLDQAAAALRQLAELVYQGESYSGIYEEICRIALQVVPGCDHACITTISAGRSPRLEATTDEVAALIDRTEWEVREGPCVDAILTDRFDCDSDITKDPTWPRLAERVLALTPVRGMVGYRITAGPQKVGALNLFSDSPDALSMEGAEVGAILASFASVAITAAREKSGAENLLAGLINNREIGKAIGVLMVTEGITDDEAFERLRTASNHLNVRLAEIARRVVADTDPGAPDLV